MTRALDGIAANRQMMLLRATLAQNVGTGCAFSGLGISLIALQQRYDASMGMTALTLSFTVLSMTALGPLIAGLVSKHGLRRLMSTGVIISMAGYLALAIAPNLTIAIAACALLIGPGAALFAALPPAILASGWFPDRQGRAMGITYLPLLITVLPMFGVGIIKNYGVAAFFLVLAAMHLLLLPLMLGVADAQYDENANDEPAITSSTKLIFTAGVFWAILVGDGILNGTAITLGAHMLPILSDYGIDMETGAQLLALSGVGSIIGSIVAGYSADRIGPAITLILSALGFASAWSIIAATSWLPMLMVAACLTGLSGAAVFPPISTLVVRIFGIHALPKILGLLGLLTLPFTFAMSPSAGWLHDVTGNYHSLSIIMATICAIAIVIFTAISRWLRGQKKSLPLAG